MTTEQWPQIVFESPRKIALVLLLSLPMTAMGWWLTQIRPDVALAGWSAFLMGALAMLACLAKLAQIKKCFVEIDTQGFTLSSLRSQTRFAWSSIETLEVSSMYGNPMLFYKLRADAPERSSAAQLSEGMSGASGGLADHYTLPLIEILALMEEARKSS
jgi:hypothetical protein